VLLQPAAPGSAGAGSDQDLIDIQALKSECPVAASSAAGLFVSLPEPDAGLAHLQHTNRKEDAMSDEIRNSETIESGEATPRQRWLSLDSWAVLLALALAALVKLHILNTVKW
jgi:hypothetical protein